MNVKYCISIIVAILISLAVTSCNSNEKAHIIIPKNLNIVNQSFFDNLYAGELIENPNRIKTFWIDSIIRKCEIKKIYIVKKDLKNKIKTKIIYDFDQFGNPKSYKLYDYKENNEIYSNSNFYYSKSKIFDSIRVLKFYGINSNNVLTVNKTKNNTLYIYHKQFNNIDEIQVNYKKNLFNIITKKEKGIIQKIDFIVPENTPISQLKNLSLKISKDTNLIKSAEINVIYTKNNRPIKAYLINQEWLQLDLVKIWEYDNLGKITSFKEFVKNTQIKNITFNYSKLNVLNYMVLNKEKYEFIYN